MAKRLREYFSKTGSEFADLFKAEEFKELPKNFVTDRGKKFRDDIIFPGSEVSFHNHHDGRQGSRIRMDVVDDLGKD